MIGPLVGSGGGEDVVAHDASVAKLPAKIKIKLLRIAFTLPSRRP